jgi:hypothetical protein
MYLTELCLAKEECLEQMGYVGWMLNQTEHIQHNPQIQSLLA